MNLKKTVTIAVLVIVGGAALVFVAGSVLMGWLFRHSQNETYEAIRGVSLSCAPGTEQKIEPWGKVGFSVSCRKGEMEHGPWQGWEAGHLSIKGEFFEGKESGTWFVYTDNGRLYRTIRYEGGKEISNIVHDTK